MFNASILIDDWHFAFEPLCVRSCPGPGPVAEPPFAVFTDSDDDIFGPFEDEEEEDIRLARPAPLLPAEDKDMALPSGPVGALPCLRCLHNVEYHPELADCALLRCLLQPG